MNRIGTLALLCALLAGVSSLAAMSTLTRDDSRFVLEASMTGLFELEASRVALDKTESKAVEAFASTLVQDHSMANAKLAEIAEMKGVAVPLDLDRDRAAKLRQLSESTAGANFDAAYLEAMKQAHEVALNLFSTASQSARDRDIKQFAKKTLPTLESHGKAASQLVRTQARR